jgi:hypothetical protein
VLEEFFGIMVKLAEDAITPGSIAGEIYERGEIPRPPLRGNIAALREPGQSASRTRNRSQVGRHIHSPGHGRDRRPTRIGNRSPGAVSDLSFNGHTNEKAL